MGVVIWEGSNEIRRKPGGARDIQSIGIANAGTPKRFRECNLVCLGLDFNGTR